MGSKWRLTGRIVPIIGSDSVKWIDLSICCSSSTSTSSWSAVSEDCGWVNGALVWRIQKSVPNALELFQVSSSQPFPIVGLRFNFPHPLSPFVFLSDSNHNNKSYSLYAFTVSGLAFLLNLSSDFSSYSLSVFPSQDLEEVNLEDYGPITTVVAAPTSGFLVLAKSDGSLFSFKFGTFVHQLRHDSGRFWGFMSRSATVGAVKDLVISEVHARMLLFVLHSDSTLRVWDLSSPSSTPIFAHAITNPTPQAAESIKLWVGETDTTSNTIPFAILHRHTLEVGLEMICVYSLKCSLGDRSILSLESSLPNISLEGGCVDVKLTSDKIWILKDSGLVFHNLFHANVAV